MQGDWDRVYGGGHPDGKSFTWEAVVIARVCTDDWAVSVAVSFLSCGVSLRYWVAQRRGVEED